MTTSAPGVATQSPQDPPASPLAGPGNRLQQCNLANQEGLKLEDNLVRKNNNAGV